MGITDYIKNGISRRGFVLGGATAGAATLLAGCSKKTGTSDDAAGEPQVIKDDSKIVSITDEYEAVDIDLEPKEVLKRSFKWRFWLLLSPGTKVTRARERKTQIGRAHV